MFEDATWRIATEIKIKEAIDAKASELRPQRFKTRLSPSSLGNECAAANFFDWRWTTPPKPQIGRMARYNELGELHEDRLTRWLRNSGWTVTDKDENGEQLSVTDFNGHLFGRVDGKLSHPEFTNGIEVLGEYKFINTRRFSVLTKRTLKKDDPKYYGQICLYMKYLDLPATLFIPTNRNDDDISPIFYPRDDAYADDLIRKAGEIATTKVRPARIAESPAFINCKICDHVDVCHGNRPPAINCRSCFHCVPTDGGKFFCERWNAVIPGKEEILKACGEYKAIV